MSDTKPDSEQTSLTNRSVVAGTTVSSTDHEAWRNDIEARIDDLIAGLKDNSNHRAGTSAPTDNSVEGQIYCDTTTNPAIWKGDPDGSGADSEFHNASRWPSFHAHLNEATQANITGVDKVDWTTETFDTNGNFASGRFTPTVAGKYWLYAILSWSSYSAGDSLTVSIFKNGSLYARGIVEASTTSGESTLVSTIADANGTTDYFEVFAQNASRDTSGVFGNATDTYFTGSRIA